MEQCIRDRYSESILNQAREAYGIKSEEIRELDGFENYMYEFSCREKEGVLRIAHSFHRSPDQIRGELDWINYLKSGGASVARPLISLNDKWLEEIDDGTGEYFLANAFEKAAGHHHRGDWSQALLFEYGRQIGLMHKLTTAYKPENLAWKRPDWDDPIHLEVERFIPPQDHKIKQVFHDLVKRTQNLPKDNSCFGLIHQDAHRGNFFVDDNDKITFFDFDDSSYSWFVEDIAMVLFYSVMQQEDPAGFTDNFLSGFLPGYFSEYGLAPIWFQEIPLFLKRREIDLYAVIHRSFDVDNLNDPWCIWYLDGRKERLEKEIPFLDFDFTNLDLHKYSSP